MSIPRTGPERSAYNAAYYQKNRERLLEAHRQWREAKREADHDRHA